MVPHSKIVKLGLELCNWHVVIFRWVASAVRDAENWRCLWIGDNKELKISVVMRLDAEQNCFHFVCAETNWTTELYLALFPWRVAPRLGCFELNFHLYSWVFVECYVKVSTLGVQDLVVLVAVQDVGVTVVARVLYLISFVNFDAETPRRTSASASRSLRYSPSGCGLPLFFFGGIPGAGAMLRLGTELADT